MTCQPAGNNAGWGRDLPTAQVESLQNALNWFSILRPVRQGPGESGAYCVVTTARRTVIGSEQPAGEDSPETIGLLRFGTGGDMTELEFDWGAGNQFAVAGGGSVEVLARVVNQNLLATASRAIEHVSAYAAWATARPATDPPLQRTFYQTIGAASTGAIVRIPPLCASVYVAPNQSGINFGQLRLEGLSSEITARTCQFETPTPYMPIPLLSRTRFVQLTNLTAGSVDIAIVCRYAL